MIKMSDLNNLGKLQRDVGSVNKLGGRDSFFGMKQIFEIILKEEHEKRGFTKPTKPGHLNYPFRFKGVGCYGNIIEWDILEETIQLLVSKYNFTEEEFQSLINWYDGESIDCLFINAGIKKYLKSINTNLE